MKYLIVKGFLGFGDRLESLKMCVHFAQQHNLQIYVDWTDSTWTHGDESFYTYFKIVNMPVLNSLDDIPADATYSPAYWKGNIKTPLTIEITSDYKNNNVNLHLDKMDRSADVLVFSCINNRNIYPDSSFFANVFRVINPHIRAGIQKRLSMAPLSTCVGIHARGTDRAKHNIRKEHSIQFMAIGARIYENRRMIAVGDDAYSIELWKRYYPNTVVFTSLAQSNTNNKGNHLATKAELKNSKYDLTVEFLTDFFTLCHCERILSTFKDSRFAHEARRLHPHVSQILGNE